jgi:hypothetical protein
MEVPNDDVGILAHQQMLETFARGFGEGKDPEGILSAMKLLKVGNVPKCYGVFAKLDEYKAKKFLSLYLALDADEKEMVNNHVKTIKDPVGASTQTTKNDKCRILELRSYVGAQALWDRALRTLSWIELDARQSVVEDEEEKVKRNAWFQLVAIFNNRTATNQFQPQNRVCRYEDGKKTSESSDNQRICNEILKKLWDLDPNDEKVRPVLLDRQR